MATTSHPILVLAYLLAPLQLRFGLENLVAKPLILLPLTLLHHLGQTRSMVAARDFLCLALSARIHL